MINNCLIPYVYLRHIAGYYFARNLIAKRVFGKSCKILEVGCGVGYGTNFISSDYTVGLDISKDALIKARKNNRHIHWVLGDGTSLPFKNESFDVVISLQVIEHIPKKKVFPYLNEIKRVLKSGGMFILTTPNRNLRLLPFQKPWNPSHEHEYSAKELENVLKRVFSSYYIKGIDAIKKIKQIEKERVKQTIIKAYIKQPLGRILRRLSLLPPLIVNERYLWEEAEKAWKLDINKINSAVFLTDDVEDCLDLFGVAFKE